jgi:hypothetical protein
MSRQFDQADTRQVLRACQNKKLAYSSPVRELRQRVDNVVPLLDPRDLSREETEDREEGKIKSVSQYWRDFMLYRRANGVFVDAIDLTEVVKSLYLSLTLLV